jgi:hypothetical protein
MNTNRTQINLLSQRGTKNENDNENENSRSDGKCHFKYYLSKFVEIC